MTTSLRRILRERLQQQQVSSVLAQTVAGLRHFETDRFPFPQHPPAARVYRISSSLPPSFIITPHRRRTCMHVAVVIGSPSRCFGTHTEIAEKAAWEKSAKTDPEEKKERERLCRRSLFLSGSARSISVSILRPARVSRSYPMQRTRHLFPFSASNGVCNVAILGWRTRLLTAASWSLPGTCPYHSFPPLSPSTSPPPENNESMR